MLETKSQGGELNLRDLLDVLRRRWIFIVLTLVPAVAASLALSMVQTPVYRAEAELLLQPGNGSLFLEGGRGGGGDPRETMETEIALINSAPVRQAVEEKVGSTSSVEVTPQGETAIIEISARDSDPARAALVANTYADAYIGYRRTQAVKELQSAGEEVLRKIDQLEQQIQALDEQVLDAPVALQSTVASRLAPERELLASQQGLFRSRLDELQVNAALEQGGAEVVSPASAPDSPIEPKPLRNATVAVAVGLVLGLGLMFITEYLDDSITLEQDLERAAPGLPVIGLIPSVTSRREQSKPELSVITDSESPTAEAYRSLRTSLRLVGVERAVNVVQVTSSIAREGKTTVAANLGVVLASGGQRTILIDADLRRPTLHRYFGLSNRIGLTSVLLGEVELAEACQRVPGERNLLVLASGPLPPDPSELFSWQRTAQVLAALRNKADMVLLDSAPILPVADSRVLAGHVDKTLLVARTGITSGKHIRRAVGLLQRGITPVIGTVLNEAAEASAYGYGYARRSHRDGDTDPGRPERSWRLDELWEGQASQSSSKSRARPKPSPIAEPEPEPQAQHQHARAQARLAQEPPQPYQTETSQRAEQSQGQARQPAPQAQPKALPQEPQPEPQPQGNPASRTIASVDRSDREAPPSIPPAAIDAALERLLAKLGPPPSTPARPQREGQANGRVREPDVVSPRHRQTDSEPPGPFTASALPTCPSCPTDSLCPTCAAALPTPNASGRGPGAQHPRSPDRARTEPVSGQAEGSPDAKVRR